MEVRDRFNAVAGQQETGTSGEAVLGVKPDPGYVVTARKPGWPLGRIEGIEVAAPWWAGAAGGRSDPGARSGAGGAGADGGPGGGPAGSAPAPAGRRRRRRRPVSSWGTTPPETAVDASSNLLLKHSEPLGQGRLTLFGVSRDQSRVFAAWFSAPEVLVLNAFDLSVERQVPLSGGITGLSVNPQNGRLWVSTLAPDTPEAGVLHELDPGGGRCCAHPPAPDRLQHALPPGRLAALPPNRAGNSLGFFDPAAGAMVHSARLPQWPTDLTLSPDGTRLFLVNLGSTRLLEVDALSGEQTRAVEIGTGSSAVAAPGREAPLRGQPEPWLRAGVDLDSGQVGDLIPVGRAPMSLSLTPDGRGIYVANAGSASVSRSTWSSARCGRRSSSGATRPCSWCARAPPEPGPGRPLAG